MRTVEPSVALPGALPGRCLATDSVGHAVRVTGDRIDGLYQVTKVDIDAAAPSEAKGFGIISAKSDATTCIVQTSGPMSGVLSGLTPGRLLFVDTDATLTATPPPRPSSGERTIQALAYAVASDVAVIAPQVALRVRPEN